MRIFIEDDDFSMDSNKKWKHSINKYPQFIIGVLAKAKNGDEQFWNIEISCSLFIVYCLQFYVCLGPESPLDER
jgi:hypothetical protein